MLSQHLDYLAGSVGVGMFHGVLGYVSWLGSRLGVPATGNSAQANPMLTGNSAWRKKSQDTLHVLSEDLEVNFF
jgi:hypothetical protein